MSNICVQSSFNVRISRTLANAVDGVLIFLYVSRLVVYTQSEAGHADVDMKYLLYLSLSFLLVSLGRMKGLLILSFTLFAKNFFIQIFYFAIAETFRHEPIEIANHDRPEFLATRVRVCARGRFVVKSLRFFCNKI